jgi:PS-10 peptidase S37
MVPFRCAPFASALFLLAWSASAVEADDLTDSLASIPQLAVVNELPAPAGFRFFVLAYEQQVNHSMPWKGTFGQRLTLLHRSLEAPMVVTTDGYDIPLEPARSEPAQIVDGNEIRVEHRFFLPSRPDPADWRDLTIRQAAADHHAIITSLKSLYTGRWLTTGRSKGGMAAIYHRRFYPHDVDGTVAYVAPNDRVNQHDSYADFLDEAGTDPACNERITQFQRAALLRRNELLPLMEAVAAAAGYTYSLLGSTDRALEFLIVDWSWGFWQLGGQAFCDLIPPQDAPIPFIYGALDAAFGFAFYSDQGLTPLIPLNYQAGTQLGYPLAAERHLGDLLRYPGENVPRSFVPADVVMPHFDQTAMLDIDLFVRVFGSGLMFVYGEDDPWSAEQFTLGPTTVDSYSFTVPGAVHSARIAQLPPSQQQEARGVIRRWAGLDVTSAAGRRVELLDRVYAVEAARPRRR